MVLPVNAVSRDISTNYNDVIDIECRAGYEYGDGTSIRSFTCTETGNWSAEIGSCQGQLFCEIFS